jgi:hypothetical protein
MPGEPIVLDGHPQESYLVEARSIPGYSGAPVFLHFTPEHPEIEWPAGVPGKPAQSKRPKIGFRIDPFLLGIDWCHILDREKPRSDVDDEPLSSVGWHVRSNTGMMGVIPVWRLWDVFESPEMKALRDQLAEQLKKNPENVALDAEHSSK